MQKDHRHHQVGADPVQAPEQPTETDGELEILDRPVRPLDRGNVEEHQDHAGNRQDQNSTNEIVPR